MIAEKKIKSSVCDHSNQEESQNEEMFPESNSIGAAQSTKCGFSSSNGNSYQNITKNRKQEEEYNRNKILSYQLIPKQQLKPINMFYLRGELFIDLNFNDFSRISNLNYFKQVRSATIVKEYGLLYIDYQVDTKQFDDHKRVAEVLKNYSDQDIYSVAEKLEAHQQVQQRHQEVKQQIMRYSSLNNITTQLMGQKRQEFMILRKEVLSSLPKERYFMFVDYSFDYSDQTFKMIGSGMNEQFIKLLGCDFKNMQDILMRKGILDFVEGKSRWKLLQRLIDHVKMSNSQVHKDGRIGIITLDDILIDSNFTSTFYNCQSNKIFENFFHPDYKDYLIDRGFLVFELQVTDFHIRKINNIRQKYIEDYQKTGFFENLSPQFDQLYTPHLLPFDGNQNDQKEENSHSMGGNMDIEGDVQINSEQNSHPLGVQYNQQNTPLRENATQSIIQELVTDIPYTIQSQYFLDKFYNTTQPQPKKEPNLQDQFPLKTCKYRLINSKS